MVYSSMVTAGMLGRTLRQTRLRQVAGLSYPCTRPNQPRIRGPRLSVRVMSRRGRGTELHGGSPVTSELEVPRC